MLGPPNDKSDKVRRVSGTGDIKLVGILVAITFALGVSGILAIPLISAKDRSGDAIEQYTATLHPDGTLDETYIYALKSSTTMMLFRYWDENLNFDIYGRGEDNIVLMTVDAPPGSIAYVKNFAGQVTILSGQASGDDINTISENAYLNEAGCYSRSDFPRRSYTISYTFKINLLLDSDSVHDHLNLMLAREHMPYKNVRIVLEDADYIAEVYQHPPSLRVAHEGDDIVISGSSAENELLEFEVLMNTGTHGFKTYQSEYLDIKSLTEQANSLYSTQYWAAYDLGSAAKAAVILTPFLFLGLWMRYGREEDVTVPRYLSTIPNPDRKPWLVNLVFRKGVSDLDENSFYATLLDLDRMKKIRIEPKEGGMKIYILDTNVEDSYEQRVIELLRKLGTLDVTSPSNPQIYFDTDTLKELDNRVTLAQKELFALTHSRTEGISSDIYAIPLVALMLLVIGTASGYIDFQMFFGLNIFFIIFYGLILFYLTFIKTSKVVKKVSDSFLIQGRQRVMYFIAIDGLLFATSLLIYLWAPVVSNLLVTPIILGVVALLQVAIAYAFPSTLFGRWRDGIYKEKLEWDAFRAHLSDHSQLSKYSTDDISMWGSWLVYGTALGVGDKVANAMKEFNIKLDAAVVATSAHTHFHPMIAARPMAGGAGGGGGIGPKRGGGGRAGGGGFGGGRGRGGGGAGRRVRAFTIHSRALPFPGRGAQKIGLQI